MRPATIGSWTAPSRGSSGCKSAGARREGLTRRTDARLPRAHRPSRSSRPEDGAIGRTSVNVAVRTLLSAGTDLSSLASKDQRSGRKEIDAIVFCETKPQNAFNMAEPPHRSGLQHVDR